MTDRAPFLCLALAGVAACAAAPSAGAPPGAAPAPRAAAPAPPRPAAPPPAVRFAPGTMRYLVHQEHHVEQDLPTGTQVQALGFRTWVRAVVGDSSGAAGYPLRLTVDSIVADSGTILPPAIDLGTARGLVFAGRLTPSGAIGELTPSDTAVARDIGQLLGGFRTFYPHLPAAGAAPGALWTDSSTVTDAAGVATITTHVTKRYRALAWADSTPARVLPIASDATYTIDGTGASGATTFTLAGTGQEHALDYLSADGRYLGGVALDSAALTLTLEAQQVAVPRRQVSRTTVTVLP